jgi:hypothetical protein
MSVPSLNPNNLTLGELFKNLVIVVENSIAVEKFKRKSRFWRTCYYNIRQFCVVFRTLERIVVKMSLSDFEFLVSFELTCSCLCSLDLPAGKSLTWCKSEFSDKI